MLWIGLTGGIASGKSTVSKMLMKAGIPVLDADQLSHEAVAQGSSGLEEVVRVFGTEVLHQNGTLDRKVLGKIVFSDPTKRQLLEQLIHPQVKKQVLLLRDQLERQGHAFAVYDVPLLFEKSMQRDFDKVVVVHCPRAVQEKRMAERDQLSREEIAARLAAQLPIENKMKEADYLLDSSKPLPDLENQVLQLVSKLKK